MANVEKAVQVTPESMNGLKTILGAALVVLAGQINVIADLIPILPSYSEQLQAVVGWIQSGMTVIEWLLKILGNGLLGVGFIHKIYKLFSK